MAYGSGSKESMESTSTISEAVSDVVHLIVITLPTLGGQMILWKMSVMKIDEMKEWRKEYEIHVDVADIMVNDDYSGQEHLADEARALDEDQRSAGTEGLQIGDVVQIGTEVLCPDDTSMPDVGGASGGDGESNVDLAKATPMETSSDNPEIAMKKEYRPSHRHKK